MNLVLRLPWLALAVFLAGARSTCASERVTSPAPWCGDAFTGASAIAALDSDGDEPCFLEPTRIPEPPSDDAPPIALPDAPCLELVTRWPAPRPPPAARQATEVRANH